MSKEPFRLFWPQKLGPYETDFTNFIVAFQQVDVRSEQISLIEKVLLEMSSYPNSQDARLRYRGFLFVLADLLRQEWIPEVRQGRLFLSPPDWASNSQVGLDSHNRKNAMRRSLLWEREAQLKKESVREFIRHMEQERPFHGHAISIKSLFADGQVLSRKLQGVIEIADKGKQESLISSIIQPYLQLITTGARCSFTGLYLQDIWRYFRYTWSTPYNSTPGRKMFYLIRDAAQEYHPIIGIAALGSSMVQLTVRDDVIGWTPKAIQERIYSRDFDDAQALRFTQMLRQTLGDALNDLALDDLLTPDEFLHPTPKILHDLADLEKQSKEERITLLQKRHDNNRESFQVPEHQLALSHLTNELMISNNGRHTLDDLAQEALYRAKRAGILRKLLQAQQNMESASQSLESAEGLRAFWQTTEGQHAIRTLVRENKKRRIGINMMDIIVCGSIPPYNFLLGGKLVAMLMASPQIVHDYQQKYAGYASTIASRMKGKEVRRDSRLVFLGTTSLYASGSSQYNRIAIPIKSQPDERACYIRYGLTEGYGSVHFSRETVDALTDLQEFIQGARLINNRFGEGVNPKLRRVRNGLAAIGFTSADDFLRHRSQRIVYGLPLGRNSYKFLCGETDDPEYYFKATSELECQEVTNYICHFWAARWLLSRIQSTRFLENVANFRPEELLHSLGYASERQASQEVMNL